MARNKVVYNIKKKYLSAIIGVVCASLVLLIICDVWALQPSAEPAKKVEEKTPILLEEILRSHFTYRRENRSDPFVPFISEQSITDQLELELEEDVLTGMRLFEPGQLTLVAIMTGSVKPFALVQDATGKGYILKVDMEIGRRGVVKTVGTNVVSIEESFLDSSGKRRKKVIQMVLRKEGEK